MARAVAWGDRSQVQMYTVYILRSLRNNRLYTGSTNNIKRRLHENNTGKSKYTKLTKPFRLVYKEIFKTRSEAVQRGMFLKTGKGREFLKKKLIG